MSFLKKLKSAFSAPSSSDKRILWLYVQCDKCDEVLRGRVDLYNDLSAQFNESTEGHFCRKVLIGSQRCYRPIEIELTFDKNRKLTDRKIKGGKFVTEADYFVEKSER
ncbi:MAG TPA: hypothetical protein DEH25_03190 [Chloroflexi bacterium]|nr:hypothetical protein [Chloroflexota bacterium]HBY08675.1 hypothetical protein [Chloroflexota bacterium]